MFSCDKLSVINCSVFPVADLFSLPSRFDRDKVALDHMMVG